MGENKDKSTVNACPAGRPDCRRGRRAGVSSLAEIFKGKANKYNHFQKLQTWYLYLTHSCKNCVRRHFSYPYTCNDGWPCGNSDWEDKGHICINWTDNNKAPVD